MMELIIDAKTTKAQARTAHRIERRQAGRPDDAAVDVSEGEQGY